MFIQLIIIAIGLALLIKGADFLILGASSISKKFKLSDLFIGLTIVAFGTSAPEFFVNISASLKGNTDLAFSNILGSNLANILLILGLSAMIYPLSFKKDIVWRQIPISLFAIFAVAFMVSDPIFFGPFATAVISRADGLLLMLLFFIFLIYLFKNKSDNELENGEIKEYLTNRSIFMVVLGLAGLGVGGGWVVSSAVEISKILGISESFVGLSIVSVGTSLPELATSMTAAYRRKSDLAIGNIIGSNIFNIFWVLGASAFINPIVVSRDFSGDIIAVISATALLLGFMFIGKKYTLDRWRGLIFLLLYIGYIFISYGRI